MIGSLFCLQKRREDFELEEPRPAGFCVDEVPKLVIHKTAQIGHSTLLPQNDYKWEEKIIVYRDRWDFDGITFNKSKPQTLDLALLYAAKT